MDGANYLLVIDYFSRYPEVCKLTSTTSNAVIQAMKNCFSHHGIPLIVRSDNGPQVDSEEFEKFSANYNFEHSTSSPRYPQSNGFVERGVKTVKNLLKKSQDPYLTLLNYRATPLSWCGRSPTELLMGRKVRTTLPQTQSQLIPKWPFLEEFKQKDTRFKNQQKRNYDKRHINTLVSSRRSLPWPPLERVHSDCMKLKTHHWSWWCTVRLFCAAGFCAVYKTIIFTTEGVELTMYTIHAMAEIEFRIFSHDFWCCVFTD